MKLTAVSDGLASANKQKEAIDASYELSTSQLCTIQAEIDALQASANSIEESQQQMKIESEKMTATKKALEEESVALQSETQKVSNARTEIETKLSGQENALTSDRTQHSEVVVSVAETESYCTTSLATIEEMDAEVQNKSSDAEQARVIYERELAEEQAAAADIARLEGELQTLNSHSNMTVAQQEAALVRSRARCEELRCKIEDLHKEAKTTNSDVEAVQKQVDTKSVNVADLQHVSQKNLLERRGLRNAIRSLKGNICVLCQLHTRGVVAGVGDVCEIVESQSGLDDDRSQLQLDEQVFEFDRVLAPDDPVLETYHEMSTVVDKAVHGGRVIVFSVGESSMEKTSSLFHPQDGLLAIAVARLFSSETEDATAASVEIQASMAKLSGNDTTEITDAAVTIHSAEEIGALLEKLQDSTDATSSTVVTLRVCRNECAPESSGSKGSIQFVDLVGTEFLENKDSDASSQAAHDDVTCLRQVLGALINGSAPPFESSAVTSLLKTCLQGEVPGSVMMVAHALLEPERCQETLRALQFASMARECVVTRRRTKGAGSKTKAR